MKIETESIVKQAVGYIWDRFKQELKLVQLTKCVPIFNKNYVSKMADAGTGTAYMQHPPRRSIFAYNQLNEDQYPNNISMDEFANFQVKSKTDNIKGPIFKIKETQLASKQSTRTRFTGVTRRFSQKLSRGKEKQQDKQLLSKYFILPPNTNNNLYELPATSPTQEEIDLEYQLRALQKKLYFTRKSKKQEEQKEEERIKELKKRKSPQKPTTDFTYQLDGNFMKRKPFTSNQLLAQHMKISQSFDLKPNDKKNIQQILAENDVGNRGRSQIGSRLQKTNLFNNSNKRQVSHLPFIKMCDNTKIREDNRNCQGNMTERISLKSFSESMQEKSFRHYSQLEKQRKQKELIAKLEARRVQKMNQELDKNPQEPQDDGYNNLIRRRQSYLMNRYLKKIRQQAPPETRKSLNFQRVGVSKNSAIHNYYKHNFNEERKYYESEVISRVLDNSIKQKQKQI